MTPEEFQGLLLSTACEEVLRDVILADSAGYVSGQDREYVRRRLAETFDAPVESVSLWIVGSAKLGFSITEKYQRGGPTLPRFRAFRPDSDIDVAVVSAPIFSAIWADLSRHAYRSPRLPWDSGLLGDYMVHGWLRPDHFPSARLRQCDQWWDLFHSLSADARFGRRSVRGALYNSYADLCHYHLRGLAECKQALELKA